MVLDSDKIQWGHRRGGFDRKNIPIGCMPIYAVVIILFGQQES